MRNKQYKILFIHLNVSTHNIIPYHMNFDWEYYIHKYKDLIPAGINNEQRALDHWNSYGQ